VAGFWCREWRPGGREDSERPGAASALVGVTGYCIRAALMQYLPGTELHQGGGEAAS